MTNAPPTTNATTQGMRDEILAYKRERILQEAVTLFYERGFTGTTLDDIAHELGVTKPFIYTHFKSKTDLLAAICLPTIQMSLDAAITAVESGGSATERLHKLIVDFTRVVLVRQPNIAVFFREEKSLERAALAEINALRLRFDRTLARLLEEGVAAGEFRLHDAKLTALAMGGMISWAYTWHRPGGRLSIEEIGQRMAELALQMAGASPPSAMHAC
ncbi:MAG TPA: TetR/AcrR family transcriptional regulator [Acetobacteraceae bacterium]|nr:TetR/AcrR family transcriptional regulator [Acetobacteraceae bacterium]